MKIKLLVPAPLLCLLLLAGATSPATGQTTATSFVDGTFNLSDWGYLAWGDAAGTNTTSQQTSGAVGDTFFQTTNSMSAGGVYQAVQLFIPSHYDPAVSGAITSLNFSLKAMSISGTQTLHFVAKQDGHVWMSATYLLATSLTSSWQTFSLSGLTASSFGYGFNPTSKVLDFSANGLPIYFGFLGSNSNNAGTQTIGVDDFSVTVNHLSAVPEPSTYAAIAGVGVLGFAAWRRRVRARSLSARE